MKIFGCGAILTALLAGVAIASAHAEDKQLNIYNWADYIGKGTIAKFEQESGIKVVYDTFDADTMLEAKVMAGGSDYDVVTTSTDFFSRQIKAGVYMKLDKSRLPNWKNLDPHVLAIEALSDPGNQHAVPYMHSINGFAYNVDMIKARMSNAPLDSLDMLFKPEIISKFADCGVSFLDSAEDVLQLALNYLHLDPNTTRPEDFKAAERLLLAVRPYIRSFDSSEYMNGLANKEVCIAMSFSADYAASRARAKAAGVDVNLAFTVPREGANASYDAFLIPVGAPHLDAAYRFIDFMLRPQVIAAVTNELHYGNDNLAANALVDPKILSDPTLYPTPAIEARLYRAAEVSAATERLRTRTWTHIKTAE
ncbi:MAG TPA: polyamine ABC transporter substrate-binding protein [Steroidobacteraceae bacterium]